MVTVGAPSPPTIVEAAGDGAAGGSCIEEDEGQRKHGEHQILIQRRSRTWCSAMPARNAAPMFHMATPATASIT